MYRSLMTWLSVGALTLLTACATSTPMALSEGAPKADKATVLMRATLANDFKTSYPLNLQVLHVEKPGAKEAADRLNFVPDAKAKIVSKEEGGASSYLLSMELPPGQYEMVAMTSMSQRILILGTFQTPLMQSVRFDKPGVYYIGHVEARVRERKEEEMRAGSVIPLIDQSVSGASGGTFDVTIHNHAEDDMKLFRTAYPSLGTTPVEVQLLAPHDTAKVRQQWESR